MDAGLADSGQRAWMGLAVRIEGLPDIQERDMSGLVSAVGEKRALTFQELLFTLQRFWADRGGVLQQPYDVEVGAGPMSPDSFLRVLVPKQIQIAYQRPPRRPADCTVANTPNR